MKKATAPQKRKNTKRIATTAKEVNKIIKDVKRARKKKAESKKLDFTPFPTLEPLEFIHPTEKVLIDFDGTRKIVSAEDVARAVENSKKLNEAPSDIKKNEFVNGQWKTPPPPYVEPTQHLFELKNDDVLSITFEGDAGPTELSGATLKECINAHIEQKDQVENLRQEAEALTTWKNGALDVLKKWNDVQDYLQKKTDGKTWGRSVAEVVLERLKDYDHFIGKMNATKTTSEVRQVINEREPTREEILEAFLYQIEGRENIYPFVIETITNQLLTKLERAASVANEASAIARKRFEEAASISQRLSPNNKYNP